MMKKAKCTRCGREYYTSEMVKTAMPNRGGAPAYMCERCANHNEYYHTSNNVIQGKTKVNKVNIGIELEVSYNDAYARNILFDFGCIPTADCSLEGRRTCEFVTGIQQGLNIASKMMATIENLIDGRHLEINDSCGTHFHISINSMKNANDEQIYMNYIRRFYHSLFIPLSEVMQENPATTKAIFGRYFNDYANPINNNSSNYNRYNFINVTNDSNIEFRLNKFVNAKQYQNLMKMEVEMVKAIITNFCEHFEDIPKDTRRYSSQTAYRKHKAQTTAKKLVTIYKKYTNN